MNERPPLPVPVTPQVKPLPVEAKRPCAKPTNLTPYVKEGKGLTQQKTEVLWMKDRVSLSQCGSRYDVLVTHVVARDAALAKGVVK